MAEERQQRRKRLTTEQKWQVFLEASRKNTSDAEVCRRWGITPFQLRAIRERVKQGGMEALGRGPGRRRKDPEKVSLEADLERANRALRRAGHREHPAAGKSEWGLIGPIRGRRLGAEIKLRIARAIEAAKRGGMPIEHACDVIQLDPRRLRRWASRGGVARTPDTRKVSSEAPGPPQRPCSAAHRLSVLQTADLCDAPPLAMIAPHRLTNDEREEIVRAAGEERYAHLRHRKLTHQLSRDGRVFCSESSVLRVLRANGLVPVYVRRSRPKRPRPEVDESEPNRSWRYDITTFPTVAGDYHLVPVLDGCSRKIVGRHFSPEATSAAVQSAWEKSLASEGLLAEEGPALPTAVSDRGTQMTSKSTQAFFVDLGITQSFSRARTPTDNASCESWMATLKCERALRRRHRDDEA